MRALNIVTIHPGWQACLRRGGGGPLRLRGMRARAAMWSTTGRSLHRYGGSTRSRRESG